MTVRELIKELDRYPKDRRVVMTGRSCGQWLDPQLVRGYGFEATGSSSVFLLDCPQFDDDKPKEFVGIRALPR